MAIRVARVTPLLNHKDAVRPLVHDDRRHPGRRRAEPGDLPGVLERVGPLTGSRNAQLAGIDVAEVRGHGAKCNRGVGPSEAHRGRLGIGERHVTS